ncbi:MAG: signal peptidase II [Deltaproteobacteria bacterium]|nr:signal peptidase II [Deltaproteobacteria bacterium]
MPRTNASLLTFLLVAAGVLLLDQASKLAVVHAGLVGPSAVIPGLLELLYRENRGGAWGLLAGASESFRMPFFVGTSLVAVVFLVWLRRKMLVHRRWVELAFPAVLGGALGNLVDRVRLGYVVDFIDMHVGGAHWPTYNVADIGITLGVIALVADSVFVPRAPAGTADELSPDPNRGLLGGTAAESVRGQPAGKSADSSMPAEPEPPAPTPLPEADAELPTPDEPHPGEASSR